MNGRAAHGAPPAAADLEITDPRLYSEGDPHATFARLRSVDPVHRHVDRTGHPYWGLTRYADQVRVHRDPETFSTEHGLTYDTFNPTGPDPAANKMLEMSGPAVHGPLRRALDEYYRRPAVAGLTDEIVAFTRTTLDAACAAGSFDFASDVADKVTSAVIFGLLGFPDEDWPELFDLSRRSQERTNATFDAAPPFHSSAQAANFEILKYLQRLVSRKVVTDPAAHLLMLTRMEVEGRRLPANEVLLNCLNIMQGGNSTSRHAASGGMLAFIEAPDQLARIRQAPGLVTPAVEEIVRWTSPAIHFIRRAMADTTIRGVDIAEGDAVTLWIISANRDEDVFENPHVFDVTRRPNPHLGFLTGPHRCLGNHVARLELRILFEEIARRGLRLRVDGEIRRVRSSFINGIESLPVHVETG